MLEVRDLEAYYGKSHVLHGISLSVKPGEVVSLIGRNGAGKSTTLKSVMGVLSDRRGTITFDGQDISRLASDQIARMGIAWVPEERAIFATLTVRENLELPPVLRPGGWTVERIYQVFPILKERGAFPRCPRSVAVKTGAFVGPRRRVMAMCRSSPGWPKRMS